MSPLTEPTRIVLRNGWQPMDPDAAAYITAVETADGQALEEKVKIAIDNFVLGCKADGIWDAIKASCILAGARTLTGALVPLAGAAPTNFNFVAGAYNRTTGLVGDGSTKYLNSNRNNNSDPQDSQHLSLYSLNSPGSGIMASDDSGSIDGMSLVAASNSRSRTNINTLHTATTPFRGVSRSSSSFFNYRINNSTSASSVASASPTSSPILIHRLKTIDGTPVFSAARVSFYSIGEALDLALLDARVTDLINKFAEVIP